MEVTVNTVKLLAANVRSARQAYEIALGRLAIATVEARKQGLPVTDARFDNDK
jgi:hypothetical protein